MPDLRELLQIKRITRTRQRTENWWRSTHPREATLQILEMPAPFKAMLEALGATQLEPSEPTDGTPRH